MFNTRVKYLPSSFSEKTKTWYPVGKIDGLTTAKDLEALIVEQQQEGFELISITPLVGSIMTNLSYVNTTTGFMVTFQKK